MVNGDSVIYDDKEKKAMEIISDLEREMLKRMDEAAPLEGKAEEIHQLVLGRIQDYFPNLKKPFSTKTLFQLTKVKNKKQILAIRAVEDWHFYIACGICSLIHETDPEKVVLSGGLSEQIDIKYLTNETIKLSLPAMKKPLINGLIGKSNLKNNAIPSKMPSPIFFLLLK